MGVMEKYLDEEIYDLSSSFITGHAMSRYSDKCQPGLTFIQVNELMRDKMKCLRKVKLQKSKKNDQYKNRETYMDTDEIIYVVEKDKIITVFPNERIFIAKTIYGNKKTGQKYL